MPRKASPYPAVNERRRKREWNRRSTAQLGRFREARRQDLNQGYSPENPHRKRKLHGLVNTGYLASLVTDPDRASMLAEARAVVEAQRAERLRAEGLVPVRAHERELPRETVPVHEHVRSTPVSGTMVSGRNVSMPVIELNESGEWLLHRPGRPSRVYRYRSEAEEALRE